MPATVYVLGDATAVSLLAPQSVATGTMSSSVFDVGSSLPEGIMMVNVNLGAAGANVSALKVQAATTSGGTYKDLTNGGSFIAGDGAAAANTIYSLPIDTRKLITADGNCGFLKVTGTVTTAACITSITAMYFKKVG